MGTLSSIPKMAPPSPENATLVEVRLVAVVAIAPGNGSAFTPVGLTANTDWPAELTENFFTALRLTCMMSEVCPDGALMVKGTMLVAIGPNRYP